MTPEERLSRHAHAVQSARDSISFALGEVDEAKHGLTEHASSEQVNQLGSVRFALDAFTQVGLLTVQLLKEVQAQLPPHTPLDVLQAVAEDDRGSEHDLT
jgi:hypothetical protein